MKFSTSLFFGLTLLSPAVALRGSREHSSVEQQANRRAQEEASNETTVDEAFDEAFQDAEALKIASTFDMTLLDVMAEDEMLEDEPFTIDKYALYSQTLRKHKSKKSSKDKDKDKKFDGDADPLCVKHCNRYMAVCEGANAFFNPDSPRGAPARRRLIAGEDMVVERLSGSVFESLGACLEACVQYPRPTNPADYLDPTELGVNTIGDTFWCRDTHLKIAETDKTTHYAAQVHCPFAGPSGGGLCTNLVVEASNGYNASAYEFIRAGAETSRHNGYCQMYFNDLVADCTSAGIDDRTLPLALALIPLDTEILILNNNVGKKDRVTGKTLGEGITEIKSEQFRDLRANVLIKALIIDDGNIKTLQADSFTALRSLETLSLNMQLIEELPTGLLGNARKLREFSIYNTKDKPGQLTSIPATLFTERAGATIQRIVISGHKGLTSLEATLFANLNEVSMLILSNNGLTNRGVNPLMFQSLFRLQIWDMSHNQFTIAPEQWLKDSLLRGWAVNLRQFYLHSNPLVKIEDNIFKDIGDAVGDDAVGGSCKLEVVLLHDTDIIGFPLELFDECLETLISYTLSPRV